MGCFKTNPDSYTINALKWEENDECKVIMSLIWLPEEYILSLLKFEVQKNLVFVSQILEFFLSNR